MKCKHEEFVWTRDGEECRQCGAGWRFCKLKMKKQTHGGARAGAGRPALPESKRRKNVTVKLDPAYAKTFTRLAKQAKISKGELLEWFLDRPESLVGVP
jgi:hypothetical protein